MAAKTRLGTSGYGQRRYLLGFSGKTPDSGIVVDLFLGTQPVSSAIKKPGIPSDAPAWERNMFEILTGRRGNAIKIPAMPTLTFSASPTKTECEELYAYVNNVRDALASLLTRMDS